MSHRTGLLVPEAEIARLARSRGVGFLYIRKGRLDDIGRAFEYGDFPPGDVRSRCTAAPPRSPT